MRPRLPMWKIAAACAAGTTLLIAGCSSSGSSSTSGSGTTAVTTGPASSAVSAILSQLNGKSLSARDSELAAMAKKAGETSVTLYTTCSDCTTMLANFKAKYGITVNLYSSDANSVLERIDQEAKAGRPGADIAMLPSINMYTLQDQKLLTAYTTPVNSQLVPGAVNKDFSALSISVAGACWNTKAFPNGPGSNWEQILENKNAHYAFNSTEVQWFAGVVQWLEQDKGYTLNAALKLFDSAAKRGSSITSSSQVASSVATGQYNVAMPGAWNQCAKEAESGAPIAETPIVNPVFGQPLGPGIVSSSKAAAADLLLIDYMLSQPTQITYAKDSGRVPSQAGIGGSLPSGSQLEMEPESIWGNATQTQYWTNLYAQVLRN